MTKCFLLMALGIVSAALFLIVIPMNICAHNWWLAALDIVMFALSCLNVRIAYKKAKEFEEILGDAILRLQFSQLAITDALISATDKQAKGANNEPENKNEDELESNQPAPDGAGE